MTVEEYNKYQDELEWAGWLKTRITKALEGTGLRPEVEVIPKTCIEEFDESGIVRKKEEPAKLRIAITMPLEWRVVNFLTLEKATADKALDIVLKIKEFAMEAWPDKMVTDRQYDMFRRLPGSFEWLTEKTPEILWRLTMCRMCETIGKRNIKDIELYDDSLVINTRRGSWMINYDNFRARLDKVEEEMRPWMRRPIRYEFLKKLRKEKENGKHQDKG
ncbi:MAG: hypothetical protein ACI3ZP_04465 [Candidatus Cryptobacteroides sp.]